jgi:hypothetical protein
MGGASNMNGVKWTVHRPLVGKSEQRRPRKTKAVGGWVILRWILEREVGVVWTGLVCLRIGTSGELL